MQLNEHRMQMRCSPRLANKPAKNCPKRVFILFYVYLLFIEKEDLPNRAILRRKIKLNRETFSILFKNVFPQLY